HGFHLIHRDRGRVAELLLLEWPRRLDRDRVFVAPLRRAPVDVAHESGDVGGGVGAEIEMVGVLVHIEGENGNSAGDPRAGVGDALVDEPLIARQQVSSTQPEPAASALAKAMNSRRQRSTEPKSRVSASAITSGTDRPSPPRLAK